MATQTLGLKIPLRIGQNGYFDSNDTTVGQVASNISNLLLTKPGERRFNNEFGSGLYSLLFEQNDLDINKDIVVDIVQKDIDKYLNGVIVNNVNVEFSEVQPDNIDANKIFISVNFIYNNMAGAAKVEISNNI